MGDQLVDASSLCWTFAQTGKCPRGDCCKWTHKRLEKEPSDSVCRAWLLWGTCPRKDTCTWDHPPVCMRSAPAEPGFGQEFQQLQPHTFAVHPGFWNSSDAFWPNGGFMYVPVAPIANYTAEDTMLSETADGTTAGQQLLSLLQPADTDAERQLKPWEEIECEEKEDKRVIEELSDLSPMKHDVLLEDMPDACEAWDQFEVNRTRFGVKSTFKEDLSQYTTALNMTQVSVEVKKEAERIAAEIEEEHEMSGCLDGDGKRRATACDDEDDEETRFSAVTRCSGVSSMPESATSQ